MLSVPISFHQLQKLKTRLQNFQPVGPAARIFLPGDFEKFGGSK